MTNKKITEADLKAYERALATARAGYKSSFIFNGKKHSVIDATRLLQFIKTQKSNQNDNEKDTTDNDASKRKSN